MANQLAEQVVTYPDFSEANPDTSGVATRGLRPINAVKSALDRKAAAKRISMGQGTFQDYLTVAGMVPGQMVNNLVEAAKSGATLPHDVMEGKVDPLSEESIRRAADLTGLIGSATLAAPKGALGAGAVRPVKLKPVRTSPIMGMGHHGNLNPGDKAVFVDGKLYTNDRAHVYALEQAARDNGFDSLDDMISKEPNKWSNLDETNFGEINDKGEFVSVAESPEISDSEIGSVTFEDYLSERSVNEDTLFAGGKRSALPGAALLASDTHAPAFYSAVERAVSSSTMKSAPGDQWLATIKNVPGIKEEELDWTGLEDALRGKKAVTKEELLKHVADNKVQVEEVWKGEGVAAHDGEDTKFSEYQLPGGENYRELLLTLPTERGGKPRVVERSGSYYLEWPNGEPVTSSTTNTPVYYYERGDAERAAGSYGRFDQGTKESPVFTSSHWDEPNVLAHVRVNDRNIGGQRTLFLEETQSDWHQKGRKEGYRQHLTKEQLDRKAELGSRYGAGQELTNQEKQELLGLNAIYEDQQAGNLIPDAPFKKTWPDLVLKRMVREAAEKGYDQIAWTDGRTQAERYGLSRYVSSIEVKPEGTSRHITINANHGVHASGLVDKSGKIIQGYDAFRDAVGKPLSDYVGKEITDKIMASSGKAKIEGLDLQVGGEGMKAFYDNELPRRANKLFGKYGAKVEEELNAISSDKLDQKIKQSAWADYEKIKQSARAEYERIKQSALADYEKIKQSARAEYERIINDPANHLKSRVHTLPITPELRRAALEEGFALFSKGAPVLPYQNDDIDDSVRLVPVEGNPFQ